MTQNQQYPAQRETNERYGERGESYVRRYWSNRK